MVSFTLPRLPYELTTTDYCGAFIYENQRSLAVGKSNGKLSRILFDGGYITFPDTTVNEVMIANLNKPQYHFYFTDHLGNVRVVTDAEGNIEQVNSYYPYGGLMASSSSIASPSSSYPANQPYRYNGKELDRKNGLDWMDYGARHFAGHGQWTSPDPLAEKYYDWSPYVYCVGNPIKFLDPDGRKVVDSKGRSIYYIDNSGNIRHTNLATNNDRMLYEGMMLTETGRKQLKQMIVSSVNIQIVYNTTHNGISFDENGKKHVSYAETQQYRSGCDNGIRKNKQGKYTTSHAIITFYLQAIEESLTDAESDNYGYSMIQALGAEGVHESVHASDKDEIHKDIWSSNGGPKRTEEEYEAKARRTEEQYRKELK